MRVDKLAFGQVRNHDRAVLTDTTEGSTDDKCSDRQLMGFLRHVWVDGKWIPPRAQGENEGTAPRRGRGGDLHIWVMRLVEIRLLPMVDIILFFVEMLRGSG
jgi:hypothetical protein